MRVFYFGNSLTMASQPRWHDNLAASVGKTWEVGWFTGAGWQPWQHRNELYRLMGREVGVPPESSASEGDLTLDPRDQSRSAEAVRTFLGNDWDAIVIQQFGPWVNRVTDQLWQRKFERPIDIGDAGAAADIIRVYLEQNPDGIVYLYSVWPAIDSGEPREVDGERIRGAEFPRRDTFDYAERWLHPYAGDLEMPWKNEFDIHRTREFAQQVLTAVKAAFPEMAAQGRIRTIPAGDLYLQLDERLREGALPGIDSINHFYTDVQHQRAGLANYTLAALFYASIFGESPSNLDWTQYNNQAAYGPDRYNDFGEVIPVTPDRAAVIHAEIEKLVGLEPSKP
ncbi:MAG: hypothetical protein ACFB21_16365 [Opitutales bacterium]